MFKKMWRQIKILSIIIIAIICLPRSIFPHHTDNIEKDDFEHYQKLNESELRLKDFKDDDETLRMKIDQLNIINKSREKHDASPVRLDILASRVANKIAREAAENGYIGHWNMNGEEPYLRYAFAGGYDHVSENAYGEWSSDNNRALTRDIRTMMKSGHERFMAERSPNDGHKKNIINKSHNYVGIGFCLSGRQFRYYEEFIDRYFEFENIPSQVRTGEQCNITVKTNGQRYLYYMIIYRENRTEPLTPKQISKRESYKDNTNEDYLEMPAWDLSRYRNGTVYKIPLNFSKEGLYYIQIFSDNKEITKPASISTKGKTPESGIVIKAYK